jgi:hypothetical protein
VDLGDDALGLDSEVPSIAVDPLSSLGALAGALDSFEDVPAFLNALVAQPESAQEDDVPDLAPIDRQLNELLTRLSLLSQDTSAALETVMHDVSRTVPRLTYDLQFMRESAVSLQGSLQLVQARVARQAAVTSKGATGTTALSPSGPTSTSTSTSTSSTPESEEARTHRALERLAYLDKLKTRMEAARDVLAEAESWSALESEITSFIADAKWAAAGERLAEAAKSLKVFQSAEGEYESKRALLVSLQNELETALSAALKDAIARVDTALCANFHDIFRMMDRGAEFQNYYLSARRAPITAAWAAAVVSDTEDEKDSARDESATPPESFNAFLPRFYAVFLETLVSEKTQIPLIFPTESAPEILSQLIQSALDELSPSFHSRLSGLAEHHGDKALPELILAFQATEQFGVSVQNIMSVFGTPTPSRFVQSPTTANPGSFSPASPTSTLPGLGLPKHTRTSSSHPSRLSVSHRFSRSLSIATTVDGTVSPSSAPLPWEATLYEPFLDLQSTYPALEKRYLSYLLKTSPAFTGRISKDSPARTLTDRAAAVFAMGDEAIIRCITFTHGFGAVGLVSALNHVVQAFLSSNTDILEHTRAVARTGARDDLDFDGLDYSTEDWSAFQLGLHVLEACRGIKDKLGAFEGKLALALAGIQPVLNVSASNPASFTVTHLATTVGAITLLQQSTLNSAELQSIVSGLATRTGSPPQLALNRARDAVSSYTRTAQVFLQGIILSPLLAQLEGYANLPVWAQPDKAPRRNELAMPSFSISPTDTIARVSEGLLNLLRVFEVYAADDALAFSIETLPFVDVESLRELLAPATPKPADALATSSSGTSTPVSAPGGAEGLSSEAVLSTWVSSLALSLLSHLTRTTLPAIRSLSSTGAAQLASDLAYLSNAVRALDVEWDDLERWREAAECKDEKEWRERAGDEVKKGVWAVVGMLRGWS